MHSPLQALTLDHAHAAALKEQLGRQQQQQQQQPEQQAQPESQQRFDQQQPFASTSAHTLDADAATTFFTSAGTTSTPSFSAASASGYYPAVTGAGTAPEVASTSLVWTPSLAAATEFPSATTSHGPDLTDLATAASPLYQMSLPTLNWGALTRSSYPSDLPSPGLFERLVSVYFSKPHLASGLINERRFRQSLTYLELPSDPRSPAPCLLHAIVATAALLVPESFYSDSEPRYWGTKTTLSCHHAKLAERALDAAFQKGRQLLQVVQASVLCCFCAYTDARFGDTWLVSAMTARLAVTVGLNHVRRSPVPPGAGAASPGGGGGEGVGGEPARTKDAHRPQRRMKEKSMLAPTSDREELDERAAVFFFAFAVDRMTSAATGWAAAIDEGACMGCSLDCRIGLTDRKSTRTQTT